MKATLCIDDAIGERRRCLLDSGGRPWRLELDRWSERGKRAKLDEVWWGRAHARMPGGSEWFVDLGLGEDGVLETRAGVTEGALVPVRVKSEGWAGKGPVLSLADMSPSAPRPEKPGRYSAPEDPFLAGVEIVETLEGQKARPHIDHAIGEALHPEADIEGGGRISISPTYALTVIDVDSARRKDNGSAFELDLNIAAAEEAARQIALRGIGGLVVVDFVTMAKAEDRTEVAARFRDALKGRLGRASRVLDISALGLCEAAIARRERLLADAWGAISAAEREGLEALRQMESEVLGGARVDVTVSREAEGWLKSDAIGWQAAFHARYRATARIASDARAPGARPDVRGIEP